MRYFLRNILLFFCYCILFLPDTYAHRSEASFIRYTENKGQWHQNIRFKAKLSSGFLYVEQSGLKYYLFKPEQIASMHGKSMYPNDELFDAHVYQLTFPNANPNLQIKPEMAFSDYENFFIGNDPSKWRNHVKGFQKIVYHEVYNNINVELYSEYQKIKYDFIIKPGGNPEQIRLQYSGADRLFLKEGKLHIQTSVNEMIEHIPLAYQIIDGEKQEISCEYRFWNDSTLCFVFPNGYDNRFPIVIDPVLVFSTYTGSFADNWGMTAAYDDDGNLYSGGIVADDGSYPVSVGAFQVSFGGKATTFGNNSLYWGADMAIVKYNATGTNRIYATYLGGRNNELPTSIIVNKKGELWIQGITRSDNFPTSATAYDRTFNGMYNPDGSNGDIDIVISKLSQDCSTLIGSTYIGGSGYDGINAINNPLHFFYADDSRGEIIIDPADNCYIITTTNSADFPVTQGVVKTSLTGNSDAVICKFNFDLSILEWSTYFGGNGWDAGYNIELASNGNVYIVGGTTSNNLPTPGNAYRMSFGGGRADGYVFCLSADAKNIIAGTYIGTNSYDQTYFIEIDDENNVYFLGHTLGNYPTQGTAFNLPTGRQFITKMNPSLTNVIFSLRFGSPVIRATPEIAFTAFLVDMCQNIYVTGWGGPNFPGQGTTINLPITPNAIQPTTDGSDFYLMVLEKDATNMWYATYFGGDRSGDHVDGGTSRFDKYGIVYHSVCASCSGGISLDDFPTTPGAWSRTNNAANCNNGSFKFNFQILDATIAEFKYDTITNQGCVPFIVNFTNQSLGAESYIWDFGDGSPTSNEENPTHTYTIPGIYTVRLVAINNNKCNKSDTTIQLVFVYAPARANFNAQAEGCSFTVNVTNNTVGGTTYIWDFGDGTRSNQYQPEPHTYNQAGQYLIKLIVNTNSFCIDSLIFPINITAEPTADFNFFPDPCIPMIRLINTSNGADDFLWDFGDGNISTERNPVHVFDAEGNYPIRLIINPGESCTDTVIQMVTVQNNQTIAGILNSDATICLGDRSPTLNVEGQRGRVVRWEISRDEGSSWNDLGKAGMTSYQPGTMTVSALFRVVIQNNDCNILITNPVKVTVERNANAGVLTSDVTLGCGFPLNPTLRLTNFLGQIDRWEFSTDHEESWQSINHTSSMYQPFNVERNTSFRVVVRTFNANCRIAFSNIIRINIQETSIGGVINENTTICLGERSPVLELKDHNGTVVQWQMSKNNGQTWTNLGKAGFNTYQPGTLTITSWFRAIVQKGNCPITPSHPVIVTVVKSVLPGMIDKDQTFCGAKKNVSMSLHGVTARDYYWEASTNQLDWQTLAHNQNEILIPELEQTMFFRIKAESAFCNVRYSKVTSLVVVPAPEAGTLESDQTICLGQRSPVLKLVNHKGTILRWEMSRDSTRTITNLGKAGFDYYQPGTLTINTWFRVVVGSDFCQPVYSGWVKITVVRSPQAGSVAGGGTICLGKTPPLLTLTGYSGKILHWQSSTNQTDWNFIDHHLPLYQPINIRQTTWFRAVIDGNQSCGNVFALPAKIHVQDEPLSAGTLSASALTVCRNGSTTLSLNAYDGIISHWEVSNDNITWQKNDHSLPEYLVYNVQQNRFFRVAVRQPLCGTVAYSNSIPIQVQPPPQPINLFADKDKLCNGENTVTFTLQNYQQGLITWQVSIDGGIHFTALQDQTPSLTLNRLSSATMVRALVKSDCDSQWTKIVNVDVLPKLEADKSFRSSCSGLSNVKLTAFGGSGKGYVYEILGRGINLNGTFFNIPMGEYDFVVKDDAGCEYHDYLSVTFEINSPEIVSFERISNNMAQVIWQGELLENTVYRLKYRALGTNEWQFISNLSVTQAILMPLLPATDYEVQVEVICAFAPNAPDQRVIAQSVIKKFRTLNLGTCKTNPPSTPTGLHLVYVGNDSVFLRWNPIPDMIHLEQGYIVSYGARTDNPNSWAQIMVCHPDTQLWVVNLRPNSAYGVRIRSNCSNCTTAIDNRDIRSAWSSSVFFATTASRFAEVNVNELNISNISIYPNPNNGSFAVQWQKDDPVRDIELLDLTGRLMAYQRIGLEGEAVSLEWNHLAEGIYILQLRTDSTLFRQRLIICK